MFRRGYHFHLQATVLKDSVETQPSIPQWRSIYVRPLTGIVVILQRYINLCGRYLAYNLKHEC